MVSITKEEAKERNITEDEICEFHLHNPDQRATLETCEKCFIIEDPCGCREGETCEECNPQELATKKAIHISTWLHDTYENLAEEEGWNTQESTKVQFDDLPEKNKRVMLRIGSRLERWMAIERGKERDRILELLRLKCLCRIRGLKVDIENGYKFEGRLQEYEELLRHLDELKFIIADIECAEKYLSKEEKEKFERLKRHGR